MLELPPLSLYVHIPWCIKKCPYCDFNSHQGDENIPEQAYLQALLKDLNHDLHWVKNRKLHSIFFGGGTPSLFSAQSIEKIISAAEKYIGFEPDIEITLEANPGSAEQRKFADFYTAGVNRLSIGVQSFNDQHLKSLGRIHNAEDAKKSH
jgi:oxygen-independent coproporphyrinogen-3 oxidase